MTAIREVSQVGQEGNLVGVSLVKVFVSFRDLKLIPSGMTVEYKARGPKIPSERVAPFISEKRVDASNLLVSLAMDGYTLTKVCASSFRKPGDWKLSYRIGFEFIRTDSAVPHTMDVAAMNVMENLFGSAGWFFDAKVYRNPASGEYPEHITVNLGGCRISKAQQNATALAELEVWEGVLEAYDLSWREEDE